MPINIEKGTKKKENNKSGNGSKIERENIMSEFMQSLMTDDFDQDKAYENIHTYVIKFDRIEYSTISNKVFQCSIESEKNDKNTPLDKMMSNIDILVSKADNMKSSDELEQEQIDTKKAIYKISDHINLAQQQFSYLRESDQEYKDRFDSLIGEQREKIMQEMTTQLLTMVSIFTALAFLIFGGISSLDSIFSAKNLTIIRIITLAIVWGLVMLDLLFVFLFCIGRLTNLTKKRKNVFKQYKIVWITNYLLIMLFMFSLWFYFIDSNGINAELLMFTKNHHLFTLIGGTLGIALLFAVFGIVLWRAMFKQNKSQKSMNNRRKK